MTCMARVITVTDSKAVAIPLTAIYAPTSGGEYVWVVGKDSSVHLRSVVLGALSTDSTVVVTKGLKVGEKVVTAGVYKLQENEQVRIID